MASEWVFCYLLNNKLTDISHRTPLLSQRTLVTDISHRTPVTISGHWLRTSKLSFYINLQRAFIGPSAALTGLKRPDIDLCRTLTGISHRTPLTISQDADWLQIYLTGHGLRLYLTGNRLYYKTPIMVLMNVDSQ